jgi:hypothetical protein
MADQTVQKVDHSALRTNQVFIIALLVIGFALDTWFIAAFVSAVMLIGTIWPGAGLFKRVYQHLLKPNGLVKPDVQVDNPEPHLFAQGLGGVFALASVLTFLADWRVVSGALTWIVIVLASLNLFLGFCAGCFVYYQLNRLGVPGFTASPVKHEPVS